MSLYFQCIIIGTHILNGWVVFLKLTTTLGKSVAEELIDGGDMSSCWTDTPFDCDGKASKYGPNYYSLRGENCPPRLDANK
jgi:hypothetical protein